MKVKKVKIPIFNHNLNVFEVTSKRDTDKLLKELKPFKMLNEDDEKEVRENIENETDGACTYYRKADCTLVVIIYLQTNETRRREVLAHEKRHVEDNILNTLGIDDKESAAYLAGYLAKEVFY